MSTSRETKTAAMYLRKSTEDSSKSVAAQEHDVRIRAQRLGINIIATYREADGTSASAVTNFDRPQFKLLLDDYQAGKFDTIMVWGLDRLTR